MVLKFHLETRLLVQFFFNCSKNNHPDYNGSSEDSLPLLGVWECKFLVRSQFGLFLNVSFACLHVLLCSCCRRWTNSQAVVTLKHCVTIFCFAFWFILKPYSDIFDVCQRISSFQKTADFFPNCSQNLYNFFLLKHPDKDKEPHWQDGQQPNAQLANCSAEKIYTEWQKQVDQPFVTHFHIELSFMHVWF